MLRLALLHLLIASSDGLRPPPITRINRRQALARTAFGATVTPFLPVLAPPPAFAVGDDIQRVIPQKTLTSALATAPQRDIIITGSNSGVGLAGAKLLTAAGHRVVCACRTQAKADAAAAACAAYAAKNGLRDGGTAVGAVCDLGSLESVRTFAASVTSVDSLVLNAGLSRGVDEKEARRTAEGFEETIGVNHLGHFLLANLLTPKLTANAAAGKTPSPRIVITASPVHDPTSGGGNVGSTATLGDLSGLTGGARFDMVDGGVYDPDKAYKDSKLCNMMFMAEASRRLKPKKVTVNAFSPGLIADPKGFFRNQNQAFATTFNAITKAAGVAETNEFGGSALAYLAVDPVVDGVSGEWFDTLPPGKHQLAVHAPSVEAQKVESQTKLWAASSKLVGVSA